MGGGLLQLVAYGSQDVYLSGNPQITFFKTAYRRHTNFSMEAIQQTFNGKPDFGRRVTCQISRNGDLIHRMYIEIVIDGSSWSTYSYVGLGMIKMVEIEIGGQRIDRQYGDWMYIWNELTLPVGKRDGYTQMVAGIDNEDPDVTQRLIIPLEFWFCRNVGLALPLIALQYHEVKLNIEFATRDECSVFEMQGLPNTMREASLWVDYIFLDTDERRRFAQLSHEYLIEQVQFTGQEGLVGTLNKINLNFNHPVKELIWVIQDNIEEYTFRRFISAAGEQMLVSAKLQLNGHDRFAERPADYFNLVQPHQHHDNTPDVGIYVYSFALKPQELQPSGSLNFSRIDSAVLQLTTLPIAYGIVAAKVRVYAVSYNVLRIMSGLGGLAYSN